MTKKQKLYSKKHLLKALKSEGLPASHPTLIDYEKKGIIKPPSQSVVYDNGTEWRMYTKQEILDNVARVKKHHASQEAK